MNFTIFDLSHPLDVDNIAMDWVAAFIELCNEFSKPSIILVLDNFSSFTALVDNGDLESCIEECCFPKSGVEDIVIKFSLGCEYLLIVFE